jgi:hypothetical protein
MRFRKILCSPTSTNYSLNARFPLVNDERRSGHFRATRRKIANPQDAPLLGLVTIVHRHDKRLKFWLGNSCRNAPEHQSVKRRNLLNRCRRHVLASTAAACLQSEHLGTNKLARFP